GWLAGVAIRESWKVVRGRPTICNMARLAVKEVVGDNRCGRCKGRGILLARVCGQCNGSGYQRLSGRRIADEIGIYVQDMNCDVINHLRKAVHVVNTL
ncbi:MAG: hypothetical protein ACU841_09590, partial [Gammaproteobacteria bacterium]